ncbi:uncharacterized protein LOC111643340 [Copidosoma floridanum]|uniref:uncharacterized protein LOC111643340 n=1 Tax=Copidosoma floridanum TaxID=29053 RepID=UPI000C6F9B66|nr:uncharacterized protein LOC111643340 [Copidosoma floridanum]
MSLRKVAKAFGVPVSTLSRKKQNPNQSKTGPPPILSETEEKKIVDWILYRAARGCPVTKNELLDSVQKFLISLDRETVFINNRPGRSWYNGFRRRHPNLSIRTVQNLSAARASVTQESLKEWFREQEDYLKSKNLLNMSPSSIFNCDETSIILNPSVNKVLTEKGARSVYNIVSSEKECLTVLFMYSASGVRAPPMVMYSYKGSIPTKVIKNTPSGWGLGISDNGWMTTESFYEYITNVFYPWLLEESIEFPVVIYLDGHSSHMTLPLVFFCRENKIELIALHPNSTHITQPLDIAYFHPLKQTWKKSVLLWKASNDDNKKAVLLSVDSKQQVSFHLILRQ